MNSSNPDLFFEVMTRLSELKLPAEAVEAHIELIGAGKVFVSIDLPKGLHLCQSFSPDEKSQAVIRYFKNYARKIK